MRLLLLLLFLSGCASLSEFDIPDTAPVEIRLTWMRVKPHEVNFFCKGGRQAYAGAPIRACAFRSDDGKECTIYTNVRDVTELMVGHEVLQHCYLGIIH